MTGYFRRTLEKNYEGGYVAGAELHNGQFVALNGDEVMPIPVGADDADTVLRVAQKTRLAGANAIVADVVSVGIDEVYMVENEWDLKPGESSTNYVLKPGMRVKMKRPLPSEQVVFNVEDDLFNTLTVGRLIVPSAGGTVAVKVLI